MTKVFCLLLAAGSGSRFGADKPKQYMQLANGKTILENSLATLSQTLPKSQILLLISPKDEYFANLNLDAYNFEVVKGGKERRDTVLNGLQYLQKQGQAQRQDWVLVQDAARTLTSQADIENLLQQIQTSQVGGILAKPITDTVKFSADNIHSEKTLDRNNLWAAQTPQVFRFGLLLESLQNSLQQGLEITDEASCIEVSGYKPILVKSEQENFKITLQEDLNLANFILQTRKVDKNN